MRMKMLCGGLFVVLMGVMTMIACDDNNDSNIPNDGNSYNNKKVAERFWGEWRPINGISVLGEYWYDININETEYKEQNFSGRWITLPAWSEENFLYIREESGNIKRTFTYEFKENGNLELIEDWEGTPFWKPKYKELIKKPE